MNLSKEISLAIKAALESGKLLKDNKSNLNKISSSEDRDTKLLADIMSEEKIKEIISNDSDYEILAEESGQSSNNLGDIFWVIDPLDGTANYNRDIPVCCISIGMIKNEEPLLGVIYDFYNNNLYVGDCENGIATLNEKPIQVSNVTRKDKGVLLTGLPIKTDLSDEALQKMIIDIQLWKKTRMIGSAAMASCYVACGKADLYKENGIYLWDIIAGAAIVKSAGGVAEIKNIKSNFQVDVIFKNAKIKD